jgi:hypothetical protein
MKNNVTPTKKTSFITPDGRYSRRNYTVSVTLTLPVPAASGYSALNWANRNTVLDFLDHGAQLGPVKILDNKGVVVASDELLKKQSEQEKLKQQLRADAAKQGA